MQLISIEKVYSSRHSIPRPGKPPLLSKVESLNLIVEMSMDTFNNFLKGFVTAVGNLYLGIVTENYHLNYKECFNENNKVENKNYMINNS